MKNTALIATIVVTSVAIIIGIAIVSEGPDENTRTAASTVNSQSVKVQSPLGIDKKDFNFGEIHIYGGKVTTLFTLKNESDEAIVIKKVTTSCMCTTATINGQVFGMDMGQAGMSPTANINVPAHSTMPLTVTFDPLAHGDNATGPITRIISIETNSSSTPLVEITVSGNVIKP